jgi:hypothetical protein
MLIAAFPATGKTRLAEVASWVDSDSSSFSWKWLSPDVRERHPEWPGNYISHIRRELADGQAVLVSTHAEVREALVKDGLHFLLAYPERGLRAEYRERMARRGSAAPLIDKIIGMWDDALDQLDAQPGCDRLILGAGRYLSDVFAWEA